MNYSSLKLKWLWTKCSLSNHPVGNGGLKVWSKETALSAVPWKQKMTYALAGPSIPGCNCLIKVWSNKKMFVTHWQIYHIDQHISHTICKHERDNVKCHYTTDREADMKHHVCNVHTERLCHSSTQNFTLRKMLGLICLLLGPSRTLRGSTRRTLKQAPSLWFGLSWTCKQKIQEVKTMSLE